MENPRSNARLWIWSAVVVLAILIATYLFAGHASAPGPIVPEAQAPATGSAVPFARLDVKHQYDATTGTHTYAGTAPLPNPCMSLSVQAYHDEFNDNSVVLAFSASTTAAVGSQCAQVVTSRPFKVSFSASKTAQVKATINGQPLILNVFEVPAGQNLDTYNVNLKG